MLDPFGSFRLGNSVVGRTWVSWGPVVGLSHPGGWLPHWIGLGSGLFFLKSVQRQLARSLCWMQGPDLAVNILRRLIPETHRGLTESPCCVECYS